VIAGATATPPELELLEEELLDELLELDELEELLLDDELELLDEELELELEDELEEDELTGPIWTTASLLVRVLTYASTRLL